jgi:hypothetical protein
MMSIEIKEEIVKYTVWHAINPTFGIGGHREFNMKNFKRVALVEATSIDDTYRITNHIDEPWWDNQEVLKHVGDSRSTSVGDVVVAENGATYLCDFVGWKEDPTDHLEMFGW